MAETKITNIQIVPELFARYVREQTAANSRIFNSGAVIQSPLLDEALQGAGKIVSLPFIKDISGASEVLSDSGSLTVNNVTSDKQTAVRLMRGKAFGANDLAVALAGNTDIMGAIAASYGRYWAREMQNLLLQTVKGLFVSSGALATSHKLSVAAEATGSVTAATKFSSTEFLNAQAKLGDAADKLTMLMVHSKVYTDMQNLNLISFEPTSDQRLQIPRYLGKEVIVCDSMPTRAGTTSGTVYTSLLCGEGAFAYAEAPCPNTVETDRDILAGSDVIANRRHFAIHPQGLKFTSSSVAGASPTDAELATAANWGKAFEDKNIAIVAFDTN